ncbi:MAG: leucyl aminopeptidase [Nanoarchaeota archaeon]|nr:leucyl aminopeptidase [Nanoarchaeota archaeon]
MKIITAKTLGEDQQALVLGIFEENTDNYKSYSKELAQELQDALKEKMFSTKFGEIYSTKMKPFHKIVVIGMGKKEELTIEKVRKLLGKAVTQVKGAKLLSFSTNIVELAASHKKLSEELVGMASAEALLLANYSFSKYLSNDKKEKMKDIELVSLQWTHAPAAFGEGLKKGRVIAETTNFVKDLVNEPAAVVTTSYLEKAAKAVAARHPMINVKVMDMEELQKEGLHALVGVGKGSATPPKLVILEYKGAKSGPFTALVGKGITFDSGGYNLKPTKYIEDMKTDMAGAAAVLGTIKAAAELGLKKNLLGVMPLAENMVSGKAQHPGDIVRAYNGKTIEIGNTDAEGRLVLCDAISYTEANYNPEIIIDLATLTGACVVALGYYAAAIMGKDDSLLEALTKAGIDSGDRVWPLPFFDEYQDWMDGTISDLNNVSMKGKGYEAGSITAGVFLSKFVEKAKWVHVDIAGSAYWSVSGDYVQKGATGSGVRLLMYYLLDQSGK